MLHWTTSWTATRRPPDPAAACTVLAARLPLRSRRYVPRFIWWALRVNRRLTRVPGVVGYALRADLQNGVFWTVSAWTDRAELGRFERTGPHRAAKRALRPVLLPATLVVWRCRADELPVRWDEVQRRIAAAGRPAATEEERERPREHRAP